MGRAVPMMLAALSTYHAGMPQLVIAAASRTRARCSPSHASAIVPARWSIRADPAHADALARLLPWTAAMTMREGKAAAYLCRDFTCDAPVTSPEALRSLWNSL